MDFFSVEWLSMLLAIIFIDLVLAGDNAIVIALAARNLPKENQKKAVIYGTVGAVVIRAIATLAVVWLLNIPGLLIAGGLMLTWISYKLLVDDKKHDHIKAGANLWTSIRTIIIADAAMGIDNVLAVAGASGGHFPLVLIGLAISIPIVVWGSTIFIKWIDRFPWIIYIGSGVLAWTAAKMLTGEEWLQDFFKEYSAVKWAIIAAVVLGVLAAGKWKNSRKETAKAAS